MTTRNFSITYAVVVLVLFYVRRKWLFSTLVMYGTVLYAKCLQELIRPISSWCLVMLPKLSFTVEVRQMQPSVERCLSKGIATRPSDNLCITCVFEWYTWLICRRWLDEPVNFTFSWESHSTEWRATRGGSRWFAWSCSLKDHTVSISDQWHALQSYCLSIPDMIWGIWLEGFTVDRWILLTKGQ